VTPTRGASGRRAYFRACDVRFPFLWTTADQPAARWHDEGEGPVAYLSTSAQGAWAEFLRHEGIMTREDLADIERALWGVEGPVALDTPNLDRATLTGDPTTYPACRNEARRLRANGSQGLLAPSAALRSQMSERFQVDRRGVYRVEVEPTRTAVMFPDSHGSFSNLIGTPLAEGHPEPRMLGDVRHFPTPNGLR